LGAEPCSARPCRTREEVYSPDEAALMALVSRPALTIDGRTGMPAFLMA